MIDNKLEIKGDFQPLPSESAQRRTGFEFEYTGIPIKQCAQLLADEFGGRIEMETELKYRVRESELGDLKVIADWELAQKISRGEYKGLPKVLKKLIRESLRKFGEIKTLFIPWEIVTEPLQFSSFHKLERMRKLLAKHEAKGVTESITFAFGTHVNCEAPDFRLDTILRYLRAFLVLYPTLVKSLDVQLGRRVLSFIDPFPSKYAKLVLNPKYRPGWEMFEKDYLRWNNTRNRALDLLPLLCQCRPGFIEKIHPSFRHMINPRPTFHYRLPNSDFSNSDWSVSAVWNSWAEIEKIAADPVKLVELCKKRRWEIKHPLLSFFRNFISNCLSVD